ncbi:group II intron reverse transcriptase/maturase, partial [Catenibacterium mitsuokai]|nr:group II intron reverse transcriptase/maturase [Catenibacterium mitsuokai]MBV3393900.1 group II intron reverse transcriptase/maturase [Catenibacterium mitsuokai]MBV3426545.1 group II intron reverse transcriptase/maturase [Catenibacterium mitsuokai]MBV3433591.1 group II intron reverse transcriptase/maturase [Catenibacterium mitsuokai]
MRLIDEILSDSNIDRAILQVKRNKGVSGVDKMTVDELDEYLYKHRREIRYSILNKKYKPQSVKRVYIPKPNGKKRPLGIPTVVDRVIQQ